MTESSYHARVRLGEELKDTFEALLLEQGILVRERDALESIAEHILMLVIGEGGSLAEVIEETGETASDILGDWLEDDSLALVEGRDGS